MLIGANTALKALDECSSWLENSIAKLNEAQVVEFHRLGSFISATLYQYIQVYSLRTSGFFPGLIEEFTNNFSDRKHLAMLQIQRDLGLANLSTTFAYKFMRLQNKVDKDVESSESNRELRLESILLSYYIKDQIICSVTNGNYHQLPRCAINKVHDFLGT